MSRRYAFLVKRELQSLQLDDMSSVEMDAQPHLPEAHRANQAPASVDGEQASNQGQPPGVENTEIHSRVPKVG